MGGQRHTPAALPLVRPGVHCIGGWVVPGPVWTGAENLARTELRSPDRLARRESLFRLCYPSRPKCNLLKCSRRVQKSRATKFGNRPFAYVGMEMN